MPDPRDRRLAELLVDTCVGVEAGWQVLVVGTPSGRPLLEELVGLIAERDAYALLRGPERRPSSGSRSPPRSSSTRSRPAMR
jgi:leucyl aminopeptidase (aminopeptidase T)